MPSSRNTRPLDDRAVTAERRGRRARRRGSGRLGWVILIAFLIAAGYVALTGYQVWGATTRDGAQSVDAIVVLGAAQYDGRPSPALQGRLDHALTLYESGYASRLVVTGGRREGDRHSEAAASAQYLEDQGVPGQAIERETVGGTSYASIAATARFLGEANLDEVLLVSDPFHSYRIRAIAQEVGLQAHVSATTASPFTGRTQTRQLLRETVAVSLGRLIGYRRLDDLGLRLRQAQVEELPQDQDS